MSPINTPPNEQSSRQLDKKIIALFVIPAVVFAVISCIEGLNDQQIADLLEIFNFSKFGAPVNGAIITFLLLLFILFAFFPLIRLIQKFFSALTGKYFVISLAALAVLGATAALYIPSYTNWFKPDTQQSTSGTQNGQGSGNQQNQSSKDPSSDLRLHLLYITGGIIAVLGLIETNRKNSQDHIRQVHAARRDRYIEAVDKLSSEQAPVRLGGVYALVGLVDEWLDDDNVDEKVRTKEGQIIINNLCSYIRSPFSLAEKREILEGPANMHVYSGNLSEDKAKLREEQDVRRTIFEEMSKRSSDFTSKDRKIVKTFLDPWNKFDFDFTQAQIFYPLNNLTIEQGNFSYAIFYGHADFSGSSFIRDTAFNDVHFTQIANFNKVTFNGKADFSTQGNTKTVFVRKATFNGTLFIQGANFNEVTFNEVADFSAQGDTKTVFGGDTTFNGTHFAQEANFNEVTFNGKADFSSQKDAKTTFVGKASFNGADFSSEAHFDELTFKEVADFSTRDNAKTTFDGKTTFNGTYFTREAKFTEVTFNKSADFSARSDIKTVFGAQATFNDVQFHKEISFNTVIFEGIADFSTKKMASVNETFMSDAEFTNTHFKKTADFSCIRSYSNNNSHKIYFKQVEFHEDSLFNNTEFQTDVHFEEVKFKGEAKFEYAHFLKSLKFYGKTIFEKTAIFSSINVSGSTKFKNVLFKNKSEFNSAEFGTFNPNTQQSTIFSKSIFIGDADFSNSHFNNTNKFEDLRFYEEVSFYDTEFNDDALFIQHSNTCIPLLLSLPSPRYDKKVTFSNAKFYGKSSFINLIIDNDSEFIYTIFHEESNFENILFKNSSPDFEDAKFTVHSSHRFTTSQNSIPCGRKKVRVPRNNKFKARKIPIGSYLFDNDPDSPIAGPA